MRSIMAHCSASDYPKSKPFLASSPTQTAWWTGRELHLSAAAALAASPFRPRPILKAPTIPLRFPVNDDSGGAASLYEP
ncbi:hypothetical protein QF002_001455 [Paraburkholderia youngii]